MDDSKVNFNINPKGDDFHAKKLLPIKIWHGIDSTIFAKGPQQVWLKLIALKRVSLQHNYQQVLSIIQDIFTEHSNKPTFLSFFIKGNKNNSRNNSKAKVKNNLYMIYGPPGTGKTTFMRILNKCLLSSLRSFGQSNVQLKHTYVQMIHFDIFTKQTENVYKAPKFIKDLKKYAVLCIDEYPTMYEPGTDTTFAHNLCKIKKIYPNLSILITSNSNQIRKIEGLQVNYCVLGKAGQLIDNRKNITLDSITNLPTKLKWQEYQYKFDKQTIINGIKLNYADLNIFKISSEKLLSIQCYPTDLYELLTKFQIIIINNFKVLNSQDQAIRLQSLIDAAEFLGHRVILQKEDRQIVTPLSVRDIIYKENSSAITDESLARSVSRLRYMSF